MNISDINPYIRLAIHSELMPNYVIKKRIIFDYELVYLREGELTFVYADKKYKCQAGQFIFIRPGIPHSFHVGSAGLLQPHIHFDVTYSSSSEVTPISFKDRDQLSPRETALIQKDRFSEYPEEPFVTFSDTHRALGLFFGIIEAPSDTAGALGQKADMIKLLSMLISDNYPECFTSVRKHSIEGQIKDYIDAEQGMDMSLSDFAKQFSYDKFYLEKRFKAEYGVSIIAYRNHIKMSLAKRMLAAESVSAVAEKLGYNSIYSFSRAFKIHFGFPPSEIKRNT